MLKLSLSRARARRPGRGFVFSRQVGTGSSVTARRTIR